MYPMQILYCGFLSISDNLNNFWEELKIRWLTEEIMKKWSPKKLVDAISYELGVGSHSCLLWWFSRYFWWSDCHEGKNLEKQDGCRGILWKNGRPKKLVNAISYEPLVGSHLNLMWWLSGYFWWSNNFWAESIKHKMDILKKKLLGKLMSLVGSHLNFMQWFCRHF